MPPSRKPSRAKRRTTTANDEPIDLATVALPPQPPPGRKTSRAKRRTTTDDDEPIDLASVALPPERPSRSRTRDAAVTVGAPPRPRRPRPAARDERVDDADVEVSRRRAAPPSLLEQAVKKVVLRFAAMGCLAVMGLGGLGVLSLIGSFVRSDRVAEVEEPGGSIDARSDRPSARVDVADAREVTPRATPHRAPKADEPRVDDAAAKAAFDEANRRINAWTGQAGFGNTPRAEEMATFFSEELQALQADGFEGGADESTRASMTDGNFISYCQLTDDQVVFLVHVPQLKNYEGDVRGQLLAMAYATAIEAVAAFDPLLDAEVMVALRGAIFYGGLAAGRTLGDDGVASTQQVGAVVDVSSLHRAFAPRASTAAAATAADR